MKKFILAVITLLVLAGIGIAIVPPPPVNQNIGMYDTRVDKLTNATCHNAACHGADDSAIANRHHALISENQTNPTNNQPFGCMDCHPIVPGGNGFSVFIERECVNCHNGTAFWGNSLGARVNITRPHHINTGYDDTGIGQPAQARQCSVCHGSFVANYNDSHYIPSYNTSFFITPYADFKAENTSSGRYWGGCFACHQHNLGASPPIMTNHDTHHGALLGVGHAEVPGPSGPGHQMDRTPGLACTWCHLSVDVHNATVNVTINGVNESVLEFRNSTMIAADLAIGALEPGTTNVTINGTSCEKCHSVQSIHNIQYNYNATNGQLGFGHIGNNWDCNGCHASWVAGAAPLQGAIIPVLDGVTPSTLTAGRPATLKITGTNFVNDAYTSVVSVDGVNYKPTSISDTQIVVNIPALKAGAHTLQLVKGGDTLSKLASLTVVSNPTIASANIRAGVITITGIGFGTKPTKDAQQYVTIAHGGNIYYSQGILKWSNTQIRAKAGSTIAKAGDLLTVTTATGESSAKIR